MKISKFKSTHYAIAHSFDDGLEGDSEKFILFHDRITFLKEINFYSESFLILFFLFTCLPKVNHSSGYHMLEYRPHLWEENLI